MNLFNKEIIIGLAQFDANFLKVAPTPMATAVQKAKQRVGAVVVGIRYAPEFNLWFIFMLW